MDLRDTLDALDAAPVTLTLDKDGSIRLAGPAWALDALRADVTQHRDLLAAHLAGRRTGHLVAFCETCGAPTMTAAKKPTGQARDIWPTCRMTPGCGGRNQHGAARSRHRPRPGDVASMRDAPAPPAQPTAPPKVATRRLLGRRPTYPSNGPFRRDPSSVSAPGAAGTDGRTIRTTTCEAPAHDKRG